MADVLRGDYINSLPQPFMVRLCGSDWWWPVYDIGVDIPLVRLDVMGKLDRKWFSEVAQIRDADGVEHDPDDWWTDSVDEG
jgi:hypothetical protein